MPIRNVIADIEQTVEVAFTDVVNSTPSQFVQKLIAKVGYAVDGLTYEIDKAVGQSVHVIVRGKTVLSENYQAGKEMVDGPSATTTPVTTGTSADPNVVSAAGGLTDDQKAAIGATIAASAPAPADPTPTVVDQAPVVDTTAPAADTTTPTQS